VFCLIALPFSGEWTAAVIVALAGVLVWNSERELEKARQQLDQLRNRADDLPEPVPTGLRLVWSRPERRKEVGAQSQGL
jgi:hypothetical protein